MILERRQSPRERRSAARRPLVAAVVKRAGETVHLAQAANIGPLGMTLRHVGDAAWAVRTPVALTFALPGGPLIQVRAEVVFDRPESGGRTVGVRFAGMAPDHAREIARFVEQHGPT